MSIDITATSEIKKIEIVLDKIRLKALTKATRRSLNKVMREMAKNDVPDAIRKQRNIKKSRIKKRFLEKFKARGSNLANLEARIQISKKAVPLIEYVKGKREPRSQKGISIRKRKKVRVAIQKGKSTVVSKGFLARVKNNKVHVFRHTSRTKSKTSGKGKRTALPIRAITTGALTFLFHDKSFRSPLEKAAATQLGPILRREFEIELDKLK